MTRTKTPLVTAITALDVVGEAAFAKRLAAAAHRPPALRARLAVQLRDKALPARERLAFGSRLRDAARGLGASLVVNDRLDLALLLEADGVHLGSGSVGVRDARTLVGDRFVSVACHSVEDVLAAADAGADAALLAPIFATPGKGPPLGLGALMSARAALDRAGHPDVGLVALGGVGPTEARACLAAGADGVALVRAELEAVLASLDG